MDAEAVINSIYNAPQFAALKKEVIEVANRRMLVIEQCGLTDARRGRIDTEIKSDPTIAEFIDPIETFALSRLYLDLASVSFGDVPTFLEFVAMRSADSSIWLEKAVNINATLFSWLTELANAVERVDAELLKDIEEKNSKKKSRRRKSANG